MQFWQFLFCLTLLSGLATAAHADSSADACLASVSALQCATTPTSLVNQSVRLAVATCEADLKANHVECSAILPEHENKKRCSAPQFCTPPQGAAETLKKCGLAVAMPYVNLAKSFITLPAAAIHEIVASAQVCITKPNCGAPNLTAEQKNELHRARQVYADRMAKLEKDAESSLCMHNDLGLGCPLPKLPCAQWDSALGGQKAELDGKGFRLAELPQKEAVAKTNFCRYALETASKQEISSRTTQVEIAEEALRLWFADYGKRWQCYQPQYVAEELCKVIGEGSTFFFGGALVTRALSLAAKGLDSAQIFNILKRTSQAAEDISSEAGAARLAAAKVIGKDERVGAGSENELEVARERVKTDSVDNVSVQSLTAGVGHRVSVEEFLKAPSFSGDRPIPNDEIFAFKLHSSGRSAEMSFATESFSDLPKKTRDLVKDIKINRSLTLTEKEREITAFVVTYSDGSSRAVKVTSNKIAVVEGADQEKAIENSAIFDHGKQITRIVQIHNHPDPRNPLVKLNYIGPSISDYLAAKMLRSQMRTRFGPSLEVESYIVPNCEHCDDLLFRIRPVDIDNFRELDP